ncbi:hypothetical protein TSUD_133450 [Trifolium subterraneum]|uniref:Uncharacterized protein n=1 Tax=Trifolium subterraneum TaxID=3900 RepID=A0A2Z6N864_TRISU|nr:hypothetical protein TSUD_133450 [Trifolium subterraneum]
MLTRIDVFQAVVVATESICTTMAKTPCVAAKKSRCARITRNLCIVMVKTLCLVATKTPPSVEPVKDHHGRVSMKSCSNTNLIVSMKWYLMQGKMARCTTSLANAETLLQGLTNEK